MSNILDHIKLSGTTYDIIDATAIHSLDGYWNSGQTESAITAATTALAETIGNMHYQTSGDVQSAISGKVDTTTFTAYTSTTATELGGYADAVKYDSDAQEVKFYHGGTGGTEVYSFDASPFLIDGMIESVVITSITSGSSTVEVLEITWNSAAGGQVTDIPLTDIFDASNYYTTAQTDNKIEEATSGKADTSAVTAVNATLTAHTADTGIHVTTSDKSTWSGKQDALVSGTNIKTINNQSLLGSGNIDVQTLPTVSGTTLVFS